MYIPEAFQINDPEKIARIMSGNSFATLISQDGSSSFASHLPFLYRREQGVNGKLISHMARANRHWQLFNKDKEVLVIFNGPHAYISPNWYEAEIAVPTWNYAIVHAYGIPKLIESDMEIAALLADTVQKHESQMPEPWSLNLPAEMQAKMQKAIVGFEIEVTRVEAKFKLGQNRSKEDRMKMLNALKNSGDAESTRLAELMENEFRQIDRE